ncbi:MAG TPA: extracellular solute-binding protein, partial [Chloroflexota bacterium]|nr:extracellular solute-binding protein [Chloroflexota bacterium]
MMDRRNDREQSPQRAATRRTILGQGALAGAAGILAACSAPGAAGEQPAAQVKAPVTLRWSTWGGDAHPFNTDAAPKTLALFNKKQPNIKVEVEPQNGKWTEKNTSEWVAGTGPDLSGHCCDNGPGWGRQGMFLNLDSYIKRDSKAIPLNDYVEWLLKLFAQPSQMGQWGLPMYTGTVALFYNKELFKKKGVAFPDETWDWNKYREASLKLADVPNNVWARREITAGAMFKRMHQAGTNIVDPKDDTKAAFGSDKALAAFTYERDVVHRDGSVAPSGGPKEQDAFKSLTGQHGGHAAIRLGRIAMWEGGSFTIIQYLKFVEDEVDWDIAPLPKGPAGRFTLATSDGWSIWSGTKQKDAAWEFLKHLQSDEHTDIATRYAGQQSARKSHQQQWVKAFKETNPKVADKALK